MGNVLDNFNITYVIHRSSLLRGKNIMYVIEEKKLTDEELAKAILQSIEYSKTITYFDEWGNCKAIMVTDILDLIHRLQAENETQRKIIEYQDGLPDLVEQQKAEIERLTEAHKNDTMLLYASGLACEQVKAEDAELQKQVETLTEEINILSKVIGSSKRKTRIYELQKQVDELKEQKAFWEGMHDRVCLKLEEYENDIGKLESEIDDLKYELKQARKETAEKFAERLKEKCKMDNPLAWNVFLIHGKTIDEICKEITEDSK